MTDLEMQKLCAAAMGIPVQHINVNPDFQRLRINPWTLYEPLTNDAQAMALVKKLKLEVAWRSNGNAAVLSADYTVRVEGGPDLNRAIVECVAKMMQGTVFIGCTFDSNAGSRFTPQTEPQAK